MSSLFSAPKAAAPIAAAALPTPTITRLPRERKQEARSIVRRKAKRRFGRASTRRTTGEDTIVGSSRSTLGA